MTGEYENVFKLAVFGDDFKAADTLMCAAISLLLESQVKLALVLTKY